MADRIDNQAPEEIEVDCDRGREMGCQSFCCSLIVRLKPGERDPLQPDNAQKQCIDKDPCTGRCVYQDAEDGLCRVWRQRPSVCREYDCNTDPNLQVVLRDGFRSIMQLAIGSSQEPPTARRNVPYRRK